MKARHEADDTRLRLRHRDAILEKVVAALQA